MSAATGALHFDSDDEYDDDADFELALLQRNAWLETPLDLSSNQFRIMKLHGGRHEDQIVCSLFVASLDSNPSYETLSYVWGDTKHTKTILVGEVEFAATLNLFDFLHHLRREHADRLIWVDAICIDQCSEEEKRHQLGLMTRVYQQSTDAHIWFGALTNSWTDEIADDSGEFKRTSTMTTEFWETVERQAQRELASFLEAGGMAPDRDQYLRTKGRSIDSLFVETLDVLESAAAGQRMHEYPIYLRDGDRYYVNRHWVDVMDCIRWLITRPWWSRVWTWQEGILPANGSVVHTSRHSFALSTLIKGIHTLDDEMISTFRRPIKYSMVFWAEYQQFPHEYIERASDLQVRRGDFLNKPNDPRHGFVLGALIHTTQARFATDIRDHFYGVFAVLAPTLQRWWLDSTRSRRMETAAQVFTACTKLIFFSSDSRSSLDLLGEAVGLLEPRARGLPSWAIDLSMRRPDLEDVNSKWNLHSACAGTAPRRPLTNSEWFSPELCVEGLKIGTVQSCASDDLLEREDDMLHFGREWLRIYRTNNPRFSEYRFWRTAFMDRDIWRYWLHRRRPLYQQRLHDIIAWWENFEANDDIYDLAPDKSNRDGRHGTYHFRALRTNMAMMQFFTTEQFDPGLGPQYLLPGDEIFVLKGGNAPAVLRRATVDGEATELFRFVGLCFVDGYMYGEALRGSPEWRELILI